MRLAPTAARTLDARVGIADIDHLEFCLVDVEVVGLLAILKRLIDGGNSAPRAPTAFAPQT
jgi:hypothetical protein